MEGMDDFLERGSRDLQPGELPSLDGSNPKLHELRVRVFLGATSHTFFSYAIPFSGSVRQGL